MLRGSDTEAIRQRGHNELSTYGIGGELKRAEWQAIGRELLRLGLVECAPGKFATLSLTPAGLDALRKRTPMVLTKQIEMVGKLLDGGQARSNAMNVVGGIACVASPARR